MKAIIVAAGRGRRLGPETALIPKCMVEVGGRPILHRQLDALAAAGATDFVIVRGYLGDRIAAPGFHLRFVENPEWETNNILASLIFAAHEMDGGFLFSYSDIVFAPAYAQAAAQSIADVALIVDRNWRETYVGRVQHPIAEAELASVRQTAAGPIVDRVGKTVVPADEAAGEFIGLAKFSDAGARALRSVWTDACSRGLDQPFGRAARLRQAYLSDALNALADQGMPLTPLLVDGRWREIDTEEDLARAHAVVDTWNKDPNHWLFRFSVGEWLAAAETELAHCAETLRRRAFRPGVTHARRAAGMAWNAVLVMSYDERYGRSYMDHVTALATDAGAPDHAQRAARILRDTSPMPPELVPLGKPDLGPLDAARILVEYARLRVGGGTQ